MRIYNRDGLRLSHIRSIVAATSQALYYDNVWIKDDRALTPRSIRISFRVGSSAGPGARRTWKGRRSVSACWHAHRDMIRAILTAYPDARVYSGLYQRIQYRGLEHFEASYRATGYANVGSMIQPAALKDLCECDSPDEGDDTQEPASPRRRRPSHPIENYRAITTKSAKPEPAFDATRYAIGATVRHREYDFEGTITECPRPGHITVKEPDGYTGDWEANKFIPA